MRNTLLPLAAVAIGLLSAAPLQAQWQERLTLSVGTTTPNEFPGPRGGAAHALATADLLGAPMSRLGVRLDAFAAAGARPTFMTMANAIGRLPTRVFTPYVLAGAGVAYESNLPWAIQAGIGLEAPVRQRRMYVEGRLHHASVTAMSVGVGVRL